MNKPSRDEIAQAFGLQKDVHGWYKTINTPTSGQRRVYFEKELDDVMQLISKQER